MAFRIDRGVFKFYDSAKADYISRFKIDDESGELVELNTAGDVVDGYLKTSGKAADSNLLDGIDSGAFLRSNTADTFTGTLTMGTQVALVANNYGRGVFGTYSSTRYQHVWSMGSAYKLADDGTNTGNLYGVAWTHQNIGGESISGLGHQMLIMTNGDTRTAIGDGIWTKYNITGSNMYAQRFYDSNNAGYYLDPASTSNVNSITSSSINTSEFFASQPAYGGFPLAPNLIHNSYMNKHDGTTPDGWSVYGNIQIEVVSPFTKAFEGPYTSTANYEANIGNYATSPEDATDSRPYWFGNYNKGPRIQRGGMRDGWHSKGDGKILKVTGSGIFTPEHCAIYPPKEENNLGAKWLFSCFVKIVKGSAFHVGTDAGYRSVSGTRLCTKAQSDAGPQGWIKVSGMLGTSQITSLDGLAMSLAIIPDANGDIEGYIALPYLANATYKGTNQDSWAGSLIDKLARQGFYIHPTNGAVTSSSGTFTIGGNQVATETWVDTNFLRTGEKAADSNLLDGKDSTAFANASHSHAWSTITSRPNPIVSASYNSSGDIITFTHDDGTTTVVDIVDNNSNTYVTGASFNTADGILTLTRNSGSVTVDLDGRYEGTGAAEAVDNALRPLISTAQTTADNAATAASTAQTTATTAETRANEAKSAVADLGNQLGTAAYTASTAYLGATAKAADANLLDGIDSSRFVFGGNATKTTNVNDFSTALASGFYDAYNTTGTPTGTWYTMINMRHNNTGNNYGSQIAVSFYSNADMYVRTISNGKYQDWSKIWNSANFDPNSKVNTGDVANLSVAEANYAQSAGEANYAASAGSVNWSAVTGKPTTFAPSSHTHSYLPLSGGTTTGNITAPNLISSGYISLNTSLYMANGMPITWGASSSVEVYNGSFYFKYRGQEVAFFDGQGAFAQDFFRLSDVNLKANINTIENALSKVNSLRGVEYTLKSSNKKSIGVIAQEVETVLPESVVEQRGYKRVNYDTLTGVMIEAIKEQQTIIDSLIARIEALENK